MEISKFEGYFTVNVESGGWVCKADFMVSLVNSDATLGRDLIKHLEIVIQGSVACDQDAVSIVSILSLVSTVHAPMPLPISTPQQTDSTVQMNYVSML